MNGLPIIKKSIAMMIPLVMLIPIIGSAAAQEDRVSQSRIVPNPPAQQQGPTDPSELENFLDGFFAKTMEEYHVVGAAIAVVKDGKLFFAKGYGYADIEKGIPVDPEQTIFRVGSVGKMFTWTAVMQLVEQGKLDLDADVNTYLDFRIPDTYPKPITLKHLMTHTSGFEDRWFGSVVSHENDLVPVRQWLISYMSARVRPPGDAGYANYNAILAGYIVARVSGQPYDQYIQEHILDPLDMRYSTAQFPVPPDLRKYASVGYMHIDGVFQAFPDYTPQLALAPSGAHQVSVADMARFMIAHLQGGRYSDEHITERRILKESTAQQMHNTLYTPDPRLNGTAYGLFDMSENGQRTLGHIGYLPPMNSLLLLVPDQNLGVFVVYNSDGGGNLTNQHSGFQRAFFNHYFPTASFAPLQPPADFAERADRFVGLYNTSSLYTTLAKLTGLFGGGYTAEISHPGDGTLLLKLEGHELRFVEVEPLYFRQVDGPFGLVFREDNRGRITHMYSDLMPQYAEVKLDWYEVPGVNIVVALSCILIFLSMIPVGLVRFVRDRRLGGDRKLSSRSVRVASWIILGICLLNLLFLVGFALGMPQIMQNGLLDLPLITKIALGLGVLAAVLTAGALVSMVLAWKNGYWGIALRAYYTLVTVAAVAFVWFLNYWNLLGWRY
jgi:CubicO group peptidase (beta-lactamase class C family)